MIRRALSALAWIALGAALGGVLLLFLGLLWTSVVLLVYAGGAWLLARCWPAAALELVKLGDMAPGLPEPRWRDNDFKQEEQRWFERYSKPRGEEPVAATPPTFLLREQYPKDGC